ncbi:MAG: GNAT family N-acetyltransferase [Saccharofermentans sp.]|nr:GNAT family N-acetyltransferase [Saccharofermentans sp.]
MIQLKNLNDNDINVISRHIADAFWEYEYSNGELGLKKFIVTHNDMFTYINAIAKAAYNSRLLYATSDKHEGYLFMAGESVGSIGFIDGMKMISAEKKALGGWKKMKKFVSDSFSDGGSIEIRMRKAKRKFIRIEVLVVRKEYQKQGFMKQMMNYVYDLADNQKLPVILDTDDENKSARYQHLGMTLERIRDCGDGYHTYDLIREPV